MNEQSIEFQMIDDDGISSAVVRSSFRVPVDDKNIWISIGQKQYALIDISFKGLSFKFFIDQDPGYTIGTVFNNCELHILEHAIHGLNAQIIHCSLIPGSQSKGSVQCGIKWKDLKKEDEQKIAAIVIQMKKKLLSYES